MNEGIRCQSLLVATLPLAQRLAALRAPEMRHRLLAEATAPTALARRVRTWDRIFLLGDPLVL